MARTQILLNQSVWVLACVRASAQRSWVRSEGRAKFIACDPL